MHQGKQIRQQLQPCAHARPMSLWVVVNNVLFLLGSGLVQAVHSNSAVLNSNCSN